MITELDPPSDTCGDPGDPGDPDDRLTTLLANLATPGPKLRVILSPQATCS